MELIKRAKDGDIAAYRDLFLNSLPASYYICRKLLKSTVAADIACTDIYKRIFGKLDKLSDNTDFTGWMKNAAAVACSAALQKHDSNVFLREVNDTNVPPAEIKYNSSLNAEQTAKLLENLFERMGTALRFVAIGFYFNGMSIAQLAAVMDVPQIRVKELLSGVNDRIQSLTKELNDKNVICTKISVQSMLELLCANNPFPEGVSFEKILNIEESGAEEEQPENEATAKSGSVKRYIIIAVVTFAVILAVIAALLYYFAVSNKKAEKDKAVISSAVSASSAVSVASVQSAASSAVVSSKAVAHIKPALPEFEFKKIEYTNENGEQSRTEQIAYKSGKISTIRTDTEVISETLNYNWNTAGNVCTVTDGAGNTTEISEYNENGDPVKIKYSEKNIVNYSWDYKYNEKGLVSSSKFKSEISGSYTFLYDKLNRVIKKTTVIGGDSYTEEFAYDENGMVTKCIKTDFDGEKTEYAYVYDYVKLTFTATVSDGTQLSGTFVKIR